MYENLWTLVGDVHRIVPQQWAGVIVTLAAVLCGGIIGWERERARKPVGLRTIILICLGSAIFTQASILIAEADHTDRGRIAAQVVTGIGFLGAGAIIREGALLIGVTTAAGIWATAAVGVVVGAGYIAAGLFFSVLIVGTLSAARLVEELVGGPCRWQTLHIFFNADDGKTRIQIQSVLEEHQHEGEIAFVGSAEGREEVVIKYCGSHRDHHTFLGPLVALPHLHSVFQD